MREGPNFQPLLRKIQSIRLKRRQKIYGCKGGVSMHTVVHQNVDHLRRKVSNKTS